MTPVLAAFGAKGLYLLYTWLASAIVAGWLSNRKGYGERPGLATGLLLHVIAIVVWLVWPARPNSFSAKHGLFGRRADKAADHGDPASAEAPERPAGPSSDA